jgi:hypothetical protein
MGRYSSVQAYADNNTGVRKVPYEQAAASTSSKSGEPKAYVKPEKVVNPYGSTAGAGSGDFHVYRHARNRELQRQKNMELSAQEQEAEEKFRVEQEANKQWEEERTAKRRKKRERQKNAKKRKLNLAKAGIVNDTTADARQDDNNGDEFTYKPGEALAPFEEKKDGRDMSSEKVTNPEKPVAIPNDGSFLEMMKKKLEAQQQQENDTSAENRDEQAAEAEKGELQEI